MVSQLKWRKGDCGLTHHGLEERLIGLFLVLVMRFLKAFLSGHPL